MDKKNFSDYISFSFEWHSIVRDVIRNIWTVFLAMLVGLMGVYIAEHSVYTPEYTSSSIIVVNVKSSSSTANLNIAMASEMANVFADVFVQPSMKKKAAENIGESSFDGKITASVMGKTNFVKISVTSSSPEKSYLLLKSVLTVYPEISESVFGNSVVNIVKNPEMPQGASNRLSNKKTLAVSFALGLVTFCSIIALSVFRETVKTEKQFEENIDAQLLGSIPHEKKKRSLKTILKKNKSPLIISNNLLLSLNYTESYQKIVTKIEHLKADEGAKIFSVVSVAENEGKTTAASNIAIMLAARGNKVLILDLDAKKPALNKIFDIKDNPENAELGELLNEKISLENFKFRRFEKSSLFMASNSKRYSDSQKWFEKGTIQKTLNVFKDLFDYVIVDTAPMSVDATVTSIVSVTDKTIVIVRNDIVKVPSINDAILTIKRVGGNLAGCVFNDVYSEFSLFGQNGSTESGYYGSGYSGYRKYSYGKRYKRSYYGYGYGYNYDSEVIKNNMILENVSEIKSENGD